MNARFFRKCCLASAVCCAGLLPLAAQSSLDVRAGASATAWYAQNAESATHFTDATGWITALSWRSRHDKTLNWCGEIFLRHKEGHVYLYQRGNLVYPYMDARLSVTYAGFSFMPEWHVPLSDGLKLVISAGPYASFISGGDVTGQSVDANGVSVPVKSPASKELQNTDLGFLLGAGVHRAIGDQLVVFAQYRYWRGINDMLKASSGALKLNCSGHEFSAGIGFLLAGRKQAAAN